MLVLQPSQPLGRQEFTSSEPVPQGAVHTGLSKTRSGTTTARLRLIFDAALPLVDPEACETRRLVLASPAGLELVSDLEHHLRERFAGVEVVTQPWRLRVDDFTLPANQFLDGLLRDGDVVIVDNVKEACTKLPGCSHKEVTPSPLGVSKEAATSRPATSHQPASKQTASLQEYVAGLRPAPSGRPTEFVHPLLGHLEIEDEDPTTYISRKLRTLGKAVRRQVEWYFGDKNWSLDEHLRKQSGKDGFVDINMVTDFERLQSLTKDVSFIAFCMQESASVEVSPCGRQLRRRGH